MIPTLPRSVRVVEVGPRDGFQNEPELLPTDVEVAFMEALAEAGLRWIEVGSFVRPDRVPRMADTEEVFRRLRPREGVTYLALVPNLRGLERAGACGVQAVVVFTAAMDTFAQATLGMTIQDSLRTFREVVRRAHEEGMRVRMQVTTVDVSAGGLGGCPFASGALGNGATEKVLCLLHGMGIETGVDLERVRLASRQLEGVLGRRLPLRVLRAGPFRSG